MRSLITILYVLATSLTAMAQETGSLLSLDRVHKCASFSVGDIPEKLQGIYGILSEGQSQKNPKFIHVTKNGIHKISSLEKRDLKGNAVFLTAGDMNQFGYCVDQKIEQVDGKLILTIDFRRDLRAAVMSHSETNKFYVSFDLKTGAGSYREDAYSMSQILLRPMVSKYEMPEMPLQKISVLPKK